MQPLDGGTPAAAPPAVGTGWTVVRRSAVRLAHNGRSYRRLVTVSRPTDAHRGLGTDPTRPCLAVDVYDTQRAVGRTAYVSLGALQGDHQRDVHAFAATAELLRLVELAFGDVRNVVDASPVPGTDWAIIRRGVVRLGRGGSRRMVTVQARRARAGAAGSGAAGSGAGREVSVTVYNTAVTEGQTVALSAREVDTAPAAFAAALKGGPLLPVIEYAFRHLRPTVGLPKAGKAHHGAVDAGVGSGAGTRAQPSPATDEDPLPSAALAAADAAASSSVLDPSDHPGWRVVRRGVAEIHLGTPTAKRCLVTVAKRVTQPLYRGTLRDGALYHVSTFTNNSNSGAAVYLSQADVDAAPAPVQAALADATTPLQPVLDLALAAVATPCGSTAPTPRTGAGGACPRYTVGTVIHPADPALPPHRVIVSATCLPDKDLQLKLYNLTTGSAAVALFPADVVRVVLGPGADPSQPDDLSRLLHRQLVVPGLGDGTQAARYAVRVGCQSLGVPTPGIALVRGSCKQVVSAGTAGLLQLAASLVVAAPRNAAAASVMVVAAGSLRCGASTSDVAGCCWLSDTAGDVHARVARAAAACKLGDGLRGVLQLGAC